MNAIENENDIGIGNKIQYYSCNNCFKREIEISE